MNENQENDGEVDKGVPSPTNNVNKAGLVCISIRGPKVGTKGSSKSGYTGRRMTCAPPESLSI